MFEALLLLKIGMLKDYTINPYFHTTILFDKTHFRKIPFSESLLSDAINWMVAAQYEVFKHFGNKDVPMENHGSDC